MLKDDYRPELPERAKREIAPLLRFLKSPKCKSLEKDFFNNGIPFVEQNDKIREVVYYDWGLRGYYPMMSWWWNTYHRDLYYDLRNNRWVSFDGDGVYKDSYIEHVSPYSCPEEWVYQNTLDWAIDRPEDMPLGAAMELMKAIGKPALASKLKLEAERTLRKNRLEKEKREARAKLEDTLRKQEEEKQRKRNQLGDRILGAGLGLMAAGIAGVSSKKLEPHFGKLLLAGPVIGYSSVRAYQHYKNRKRR